MTVVVVVVLVAATLAFAVVEGAAIVGLFGVLFGEGVARCPRCHRYGLTTGGAIHEGECPEHLGARLLHRWALLSHRAHSVGFHLRHH
jgi:hypothetical protein